jgi:DNA-binding GntR family transcriptional regulator
LDPAAEALADRLRQRIAGCDLPPGARLVAADLADISGEPLAVVETALSGLAGEGALVPQADRWSVASQPQATAAFLLRAGPTLVALVRLAADNAGAEDTARIRNALDRLAGRAGGRDLESRKQGYRDYMGAIAVATGSFVQRDLVRRFLAEAEPLIDRLVRFDMQVCDLSSPESELRRLARAIEARDPAAAAQEAEDHMLLVACRANGGA